MASGYMFMFIELGQDIMKTPWRKGSASDSSPEGCAFKSRRGQMSFCRQNCGAIILFCWKSAERLIFGLHCIPQLFWECGFQSLRSYFCDTKIKYSVSEVQVQRGKYNASICIC
jgi:hypothetical protein